MRATATESPAIPAPDAPAERDHWRQALDEYLSKKERTARLRAELAEARAAGKRIRHANRLRRAQRR